MMSNNNNRIVREVAAAYSGSVRPRLSLGYLCFVTSILSFALLTYAQFVSSEEFTPLLVWGTSSLFAFSVLTISVGHQAFHGAFTRHTRIDRLIGFLAFIPLGLDGYLWQRRHITEHHPEPNREGYDEDIDNPTYFRLALYTPHRWYHHYQHLYAPILYSIGLPITITIDDARQLTREITRLKVGGRIRRARHSAMRFILGKLLFIVMWFVLPMCFSSISSISTSTVMLLCASIPISWFFLPIGAAHLNEHTHFFTSSENADFFTQQRETTVDFSRNSTFVTWLYGGLNCHLAHHLWPRIPANHYKALSEALKFRLNTGNDLVPNLSFFELYRSHFRLLRRLGQSQC